MIRLRPRISATTEGCDALSLRAASPWSWWMQIFVAGALSVLLLFALRPPLLRLLKSGSDPLKTNVDALLGLRGTVSADFAGAMGHVKLANGETWTARLAIPPPSPLQAGDRVVVTAIEGATAVVVLTERSVRD